MNRLSNEPRNDFYPWEDAYVGEPQQRAPQQQDLSHSTSSIDAAEILQRMLKNAADQAPPPAPEMDEDDDFDEFPPAPILPPSSIKPPPKAPDVEDGADSVQSLLQLAAQAEEQARLTEAAANTAGELAQQMLKQMQQSGQSDPSLQQLSMSASQNAILASEAALHAQMSAMEAHAAAVHQSLAELDTAKTTLQHYSHDFIQLSKLSSQAQEEAKQAREQVNRARLGYAAKHNTALSARDNLLQTKKDYEAQLMRVHQAQQNLEQSQIQARESQQNYLELQAKLDQRRKTWEDLKDFQAMMPPEALAELTAGRKEAAAVAQNLAQTERVAASQPPPEPAAQPPTTARPAAPRAGAPTLAASTAAAEAAAASQTAAPTFPVPKKQRLAKPPLPSTEPAEAEEDDEAKPRNNWFMVKMLIAVVALSLLLKFFAMDFAWVENISMNPTLRDGDFVLNSKITYVFSEPQRGDIVIIHVSANERYVKRIIGLPGEKLDIIDGQVYINDQLLTETYIADPNYHIRDGYEDLHTYVPDNQYFVMGDNRAHSSDSRNELGTVHIDDIMGKIVFRVWPLYSITRF